MRGVRWLSLLALCCALDLAVPLVPTAHGLEVEEDEEVVHPGGWRLARPSEAARTPQGAVPVTEAGRAVTVHPRPARPALERLAPRPHTAVDPSASPSTSAEDH